MPYLIDGHNLIPRIPGLSLQDPDDETALIQILQRFSARRRTKVEVFFDQAPPGQAATRTFGPVTAHYIHQGSTADAAIVKRLVRLGARAKNWTVVTSDREIIAEAKSSRSKVIPSDEFARMALSAGEKVPGKGGSKEEAPQITSGDVDYWLEQFNGKD